MAAGGGQRRSVTDLIGSGPPPAQQDLPQPIGVPEDYLAPPRPRGTFDPGSSSLAAFESPQRPVAPRYFEGSEWLPASMSAEDIARLQREMEAAGVLSKGTKYRLGVWDDASRSAYRELLSTANASGVDVRTALGQWQAGVSVDDEETRQQDLPMNPLDIRALAQDAAQVRIGRKLRDDELERFESAFRSQVDEPYMADPETGLRTGFQAPGGAGTAMWAEDQLEQMAPGEAFAQEGAERANEFFDLLGGVV